ncbi:MAG TPA: hypothetical protein VMM12_07655 [Longimicrobiales bacterium]|nr:hypothetical protein [Longimicrobiales bacterium]
MRRPAGSLVQWFREQDLLRGPFLFVDYWANIFGLRGVTPDDHVTRGFIDLPLFRLGIDRPQLEVPRLRSYLLLFLVGPFLFAFRSFRRIGRYRLGFRTGRSRQVLDSLDRFRLVLDPAGHEPDPAGDPHLGPRCDVRIGDTVLARDVLDPYRVAGFSSLFWAANKLPIASLIGLIVAAIMAPFLASPGILQVFGRFWVPVGFVLLVLVLYVAFREWLTALLGALPILLGTFLVDVLRPSTPTDWSVFFWSLGGIFLLYLLADWFFVPRPVPPALLLYTAHGPGRPYARDQDAPWWIEGNVYWVWRYLLLSPAELNKFWERDWERIDLWIRADGPEAGHLEWVVTDLHYRELWVPYHKLGDPDVLRRQREKARAAATGDSAGIWLVEVDADLVFHSPVLRGVSFLVDTGGVPVRGIMHVVRSLWRRIRDRDLAEPTRAVERIRLERGLDLLGDIPEFISRQATRRVLEAPWTYWRYPLGASRRRDPLLYDPLLPTDPPPAADPSLQVKAPRG